MISVTICLHFKDLLGIMCIFRRRMLNPRAYCLANSCFHSETLNLTFQHIMTYISLEITNIKAYMHYYCPYCPTNH